MLAKHGLLPALVLLLSATSFGDVGEEPVTLDTFGNHSRLRFRIDEGTVPAWEERRDGFTLRLKGVWLADLGAPMGGEAEWARRMSGRLKDERLDSVRFEEDSSGVKIVGRWRFPTGSRALANPVMEHYDFREKEPVRYVVDFWTKRGPSLLEIEEARVAREKAESVRKAEADIRRRRDRRVAAEKARHDAEDMSRFCVQPLSESKDVFLPFVPAHALPDFEAYFSVTTADSRYDYLEPAGNAKDAQYLRLALDLYRQGKPALAIRTADFFDAEHPGSVYRHEMKFLRANAMIKLGHREQAEPLLLSLKQLAKDSPVAMHSGAYLAIQAFKRKQYLASLEGFLWLAQAYPQHRMRWVFHWGAAESLYQLKQTDRAAKEYQWVVVNAKERKAKSEAALRLGDIYLDRQLYERSLAEYYQGSKRFLKEAAAQPQFRLNRAETLYWLEERERAEKEFKAFLADFPAHPDGWRATFRLGELEGRKAGDAAIAASRGWFYDTINHYPFSPGATLARARLLPCGDHGKFNLDSAERFFSGEAMKFDGGGEISMARYPDFRALSRVRTLVTLTTGLEGEGREKAIRAAIDELRFPLRKESRELLGTVLAHLFQGSVSALMSSGRTFEALKFYEKYAGSVPAGELEPAYLLRLSRSAADLGMGGLASRLAADHRAAMTELARRGRAVAEAGGEDDLEPRLKKAEATYTEAKAEWVSVGAGEPTPASEAKIRGLLAQVPEESEFSFEREVLLGLLDERAGKTPAAIGHAARAQLLLSKQKPTDDPVRVDYWIARLHAKGGDKRVASELLARLERIQLAKGLAQGRSAVLGLEALPSKETLILAQGELLSGQGHWGEAAAAYSRAVEGGVGGNHALYEYARALRQTGEKKDRARATAALKKLAESGTDDFWRKLARESLAQERSETENAAREGGPK